MPDVGQELLNVPFPEMVQKLAFAIAEGQTKLDIESAKVAQFMAKTKIELPKIAGEGEESEEFSMLAMGFFPGFYHFEESIIKVTMAITMAQTDEKGGEAEVEAGWGPFSASVNATYSSKYNYNVEGSSTLEVRLTPVPAPAILTNYMEALIEKKSKEFRDAARTGGGNNE